MKLTVTVDGEEQFATHLEGTSERIENDEAAMEAIGLIGLRRSQSAFAAQGWDGEPWIELQPATIAGRRNKDKASIQILRDTGLLLQSLSTEGQYSQWLLNNHQVQWGTNRPGASAHQDGDGHVPKRQFVGVTQSDFEDFGRVYLDTAFGFGEEA